MLADFLDRSLEVYRGDEGVWPQARAWKVGITGASLGLPGTERVFDDDHVARLLAGEQLIDAVPPALRTAMLDRRITRLVKGAGGEASFETISDPGDVVKLAGRGGALELAAEYGFPEDRLQALDRTTQLAIAAGIDALRDAGVPLVRRYRATTTGSHLPDGWVLPEEMRDDTGVIFASAFPGYDAFARAMDDFHRDRTLRERLEELQALQAEASDAGPGMRGALERRIEAVTSEIEASPFAFDRRFLFQVLAMGHSQFAEYVGARGPNALVNVACASGTLAVGLARDWILADRCRRVIVVSGDDITTDALFPWFGGGFLASGAAATDERVEDA
ncbi:MAG TPA: hypothetical protein VE173_11440, partial [Longimicrobiales bacterium]|nr:hypothetical protein [Longimicrobiales bacterium]